MKQATSKTTKKPAKASIDDRLGQVEGQLRQRIADGGATADQLQSILSMINPSEVASPSAPVA